MCVTFESKVEKLQKTSGCAIKSVKDLCRQKMPIGVDLLFELNMDEYGRE